MNPLIIAHRGASYLAQYENTLEAFQIAIDIKADMVEFDVRQTIDKQLVVFHDERLGGVSINSLTYQQLNSAANKLGYHIPTLVEVLTLCRGKIRLDIELKEAGYEKRVISLVNSMYEYRDYSLKSFLDIVVRRIKKIDEKVTVGLLIGTKDTDFSTHFNEYFPKRRLQSCKADFVSPNYRLATPDFLQRMQRLQIPVYVWTVNDPKRISEYLTSSVAGIITDRPDVGIYLQKKNFLNEQEMQGKRKKRKELTHTLIQKAYALVPKHRVASDNSNSKETTGSL